MMASVSFVGVKDFLCEFLLGKEAEISFYRDMNKKDDVFVRYPVLGSDAEKCFEVSSLRSKRFADWSFNYALAREQEVASNSVGSDVVSTDGTTENEANNEVEIAVSKSEANKKRLRLRDVSEILKEANALASRDQSIPEFPVAKRMICYDGKIYLNLNNKHKVVEITSENWSIIDDYKAPILFLNSSFLRALPKPQEGGNLKDLQKFVNVDDKDFSLVVGWLLAACNSNIDCPVLHVEASQGSGKTTATGFLKDLIDPDEAGVIAPLSGERDLLAVSTKLSVLCLDNVSKLSRKKSYELCRVCRCL